MPVAEEEPVEPDVASVRIMTESLVLLASDVAVEVGAHDGIGTTSAAPVAVEGDC